MACGQCLPSGAFMALFSCSTNSLKFEELKKGEENLTSNEKKNNQGPKDLNNLEVSQKIKQDQKI